MGRVTAHRRCQAALPVGSAPDRSLARTPAWNQSKGILMERFALDEDEAFQRLVRFSQETNIKVVDVAHSLQRDAAERRTIRREAATDSEPGR